MSSQTKQQLEKKLEELNEKLRNQKLSKVTGEAFDDRFDKSPRVVNDINPVEIAKEIKKTEEEIAGIENELSDME